MKTLLELQPLIIEWAREKGLVDESTAPKQRLKLVEEAGETAKAILHNDIPKTKDGIGDMFVVLVILFEQEKKDLYFSFRSDGFDNNLSWMFFVIIEFAETMNGYVLEWLNLIAEKTGNDLTKCANIAWNEIKERKGELIEGVFIKESDLKTIKK